MMANGTPYTTTRPEGNAFYQLKIRQQPECARVAIGKEKGKSSAIHSDWEHLLIGV